MRMAKASVNPCHCRLACRSSLVADLDELVTEIVELAWEQFCRQELQRSTPMTSVERGAL